MSTETAPALMILNEIELQFRDRTKQPWNAFQFIEAWESRTDTDGMSKSADRTRQSLINEQIPPNKYTVPAGAARKYLYLFRGDFPKYGNADLYIPVLGTNERPVARAEFRYEF